MDQMKPEDVKELLRQVPCPGRSRNIVALGFIKGIAVEKNNILVEFTPDTQNVAKILAMEEGIREVLRQAQFNEIELDTEPPYDDSSMMLGGPSSNPLQVDLSEYGIDPNPDVIEGPGKRAKNLMSPEAPSEDNPAFAADGLDEFGALPSEGPQGNLDPSYDGELAVFQWEIDPENENNKTVKRKLSVGSWNFVVCWLVHQPQDLVYASLQARHWIYNDGVARPNPAGRTEGVNLVYDRKRAGVVAIYGTVKDFRPFVKAFHRAFTAEDGVAEAVAPPSEARAPA